MREQRDEWEMREQRDGVGDERAERRVGVTVINLCLFVKLYQFCFCTLDKRPHTKEPRYKADHFALQVYSTLHIVYTATTEHGGNGTWG